MTTEANGLQWCGECISAHEHPNDPSSRCYTCKRRSGFVKAETHAEGSEHDAQVVALTAALREANEDAARLAHSNTWVQVDDDGISAACIHCGKHAKYERDVIHRPDCPITLHRARVGGAAQRWIPVGERLPEDRATVLVAFTEYPERIDILTATYYKRYEGFGVVNNWWDIEGWHSRNVTHWMPLPELPEVKE